MSNDFLTTIFALSEAEVILLIALFCQVALNSRIF